MYIKNFTNLRISTKYTFRYFSNKVNLQINPLKCLHDEPLHIAASNLPPSSNVTLVSSIIDHKGTYFQTNTHYSLKNIEKNIHIQSLLQKLNHFILFTCIVNVSVQIKYEPSDRQKVFRNT
ncbi:hypothetical protein Avbf_04257 [Armadillidium vulgare]|nr:hypothetical protein Avbf_04257 [Armadillidium vulgare]